MVIRGASLPSLYNTVFSLTQQHTWYPYPTTLVSITLGTTSHISFCSLSSSPHYNIRSVTAGTLFTGLDYMLQVVSLELLGCQKSPRGLPGRCTRRRARLLRGNVRIPETGFASHILPEAVALPITWSFAVLIWDFTCDQSVIWFWGKLYLEMRAPSYT